jgi:hypothetical protein
MPMIPATWELENGNITGQGHAKKNVIKIMKIGLVEWLGGEFKKKDKFYAQCILLQVKR